MEEQSQQKEASFFSQMPPRFAFWAGVIASIAVMSIVGFIVMTVLVLNDNGTSTTKTAAVANANTNAAAAAPAAAAETVPSGSIDLASITNIQGKGDLTLVEYSDLQCPYCSQFHPTLKQVIKDFDGKVKWGYKHFPLTSIHPYAEKAAIAAECAAEQDKFWEFADNIFSNQSALATTGIDDAAAVLGLDTSKFNDCMTKQDVLTKVSADADEAQTLGGRGTPFSVLIDKDGKIVDVISGALPLASVKATIEANL